MLGGITSTVSISTTGDKTMVRSQKSRDRIRRRLAMIRQQKDKKKLTGSCLTPPSLDKDLGLCGQIEEESRDAPSVTALKQNKPYMESQSNALSTQQISNPNEDHREGINDVPGYSCPLFPIFMQEGQNERNHLSDLPMESNTSSQEKLASSSTTTFHVRLSIGKITGLKIDEIFKRTKQSTNNRITVGFVELLSSGKYTALSQPLLINVEEPKKSRTILWAIQHDGEEASKSKSRRCLHFSLTLKRESSDSDSYEDTDDNDDSSVYSFMPEVVKLLVGLKCGDERIPLGIAKFVVNGREAFEQSMDLIVLPVTDQAAGWRTKRGIFDKKQRNSFTNGKLAFTIAPGAKLRIKADVKIAYPGQNGAEIWGDEDCSYASATEHPFDSGAVLSSENVFPSRYSLTFSTIKVSSPKWKGRQSPPNTSFRKSQKVEKYCGSDDTDFSISKLQKQKEIYEGPFNFVYIDKSSGIVSVSSDISNRPGHSKSWACEPLLCGGCVTGFSAAPYPGLYDKNFSFESDEAMENKADSFNYELRSLNLSGTSSCDSSSCLPNSREY